ncbi:MAG TPA: endonuclease/exonuclease/phosphatase family protein [Isosphaeraceae bacterium]|jgi:endonuclease/exonuclease/phosphatase family metal-dependent hydrolase|nr:endonuclease/exonuclease/phosphatase family protein [Isosphaeraceae bacterium]
MRRPLSGWERDWLVPALVATLVVLLLFWLAEPPRPAAAPGGAGPSSPRGDGPEPPEGGYLFCTWNVENLFDDDDDPRVHDDDEDWFGHNPELVRQKVAHLARALLLQNDGRGPDILAAVEVENRRAAELLRDALNAGLPAALQYNGLVFRENRTGRHIAPMVLTRLPCRDDLTRTFGARRILEAHVEARGAPLIVLASHWTSRVTDATDVKRTAYAAAVYRAFLDRYRADPRADVILAGDYNDGPDDPALVDGLHTTSDPALVRADGPRPRLLDLMAGRDPRLFGTYLYQRRWQALDHIVASPGLLDPSGWLALPETLRVEAPTPLRAGRDGRPFRFGGPRQAGPRGYSDHFAVTLRLRVTSEVP